MIALQIIATLALAGFAGWSYRLGGSDNGFGHWFRMFGMMIAMALGLWLWFGWTNWILLSAGFCWAESTYFKKKGTDATFVNYCMAGAVFAVIPLPVVWATGHHWPWMIWTGAVTVPLIGGWCVLFGTVIPNVQWSEGGRGAMQLLRFLLLLIPFLK